MASQGFQGKARPVRDEVIVRLHSVSGYQFYWKPEDLLWQFENDLRKLLYNAGLRGTFEVKQAGRRERGNKREGITLGPAQNFAIEVRAEYGHNSQADIWTLKVDAKDTAPIRERLSRALQGEVLEPPKPPEPVSKDDIEKDLIMADRPGLQGELPPPKSYPPRGNLFEREPVTLAYCWVFAWGEASNQGYIQKGAITNIAVEYWELTEKHSATAVHKAVIRFNLMTKARYGNYGFTSEGKAFVRKYREQLLASPKFHQKMEGLAQVDNPHFVDGAARVLQRVRRLLKIQ